MEPPATAWDGRLDDRVVRALSEQPGRLPFGRLRRSLGAHPESLTRTLRRLERLGTVGHDGQGYFLVERTEAATIPTPGGQSTELVSVRLPPGLPTETVLGLIAGRWFGELRWAGSLEEGEETALAWELPGVPGLLVLRTRRGRLTITAERAGDGPLDGRLIPAAEELLWHGLRRLRTVVGEARAVGPSDPRGTAYFRASDPGDRTAPVWAS